MIRIRCQDLGLFDACSCILLCFAEAWFCPITGQTRFTERAHCECHFFPKTIVHSYSHIVIGFDIRQYGTRV